MEAREEGFHQITYFAVDDEKSKKVVSFRITKGYIHDTKKFGPLIKEASEKCEILIRFTRR